MNIWLYIFNSNFILFNIVIVYLSLFYLFWFLFFIENLETWRFISTFNIEMLHWCLFNWLDFFNNWFGFFNNWFGFFNNWLGFFNNWFAFFNDWFFLFNNFNWMLFFFLNLYFFWFFNLFIFNLNLLILISEWSYLIIILTSIHYVCIDVKFNQLFFISLIVLVCIRLFLLNRIFFLLDNNSPMWWFLSFDLFLLSLTITSLS